jgi:hypothetical protein
MPKTLADQLREAIREAGSLYSVCKGTGVAYQVLWRFMAGMRDLRVKTAGKVTAFLGLRLVAGKQSRKGRVKQ